MKANSTWLILALAGLGVAAWMLFRKPTTATAAASNQNFVPSSRVPINPQLGFRSGFGGRGTDWGQVAGAGASVIGGIAGLFKKSSSPTPTGIYSPSVTSSQTNDMGTWVDTPADTGSVSSGAFEEMWA